MVFLLFLAPQTIQHQWFPHGFFIKNAQWSLRSLLDAECSLQVLQPRRVGVRQMENTHLNWPNMAQSFMALRYHDKITVLLEGCLFEVHDLTYTSSSHSLEAQMPSAVQLHGIHRKEVKV